MFGMKTLKDNDKDMIEVKEDDKGLVKDFK